MELWIRSQDKERLTKATDLRIYKALDEEVWVIEDCDDLGYYKTKERAIEVLGDIQNMLRFFKGEGFTGEGLISIENNLGIYQMPKE